MKHPHKLTIEITGKGYQQTLTDESGEVLYEQKHRMDSWGVSEPVAGEAPFDTPFFADNEELFGELGEAIDALSFGPFGVASALNKMS